MEEVNLEYSRRLDKTKKLGSIPELVDYIFNLIIERGFFEYKYKSKKDNLKKHIDLMVIELYSRYIEDKTGFISFDKNSNNYINKNREDRYNCNDISRILIDVCDYMVELKLIEYHKGLNYIKIKRLSRIKASNELIKLFKKYNLTSTDNIKFNREVLIMKNSKKEPVNYVETKETLKTRREIINYNNLLNKTNITLSKIPTNELVFFHHKNVHRIFNRDGNGNGRHYGAWWQLIGSNKRKSILINEKLTTELDFKSMHPTLLYLKEGIDITNTKFNPYLSRIPKVRNIYKMLLLCMINANSKRDALHAAIYNIKTDAISQPEKYPDNILEINMNDYINIRDQIYNHNQKIKKYFFKGIGIKLMLEDSYITSIIIDYFTKINIPVLTIFDSFIIESNYIDLLRFKMIGAYNNNLKAFGYPFSKITPLIK